MSFLLYLQLKWQACQQALKAKATAFIERHVVADDPYDETTRVLSEREKKEAVKGELSEREDE